MRISFIYSRFMTPEKILTKLLLMNVGMNLSDKETSDTSTGCGTEVHFPELLRSAHRPLT